MNKFLTISVLVFLLKTSLSSQNAYETLQADSLQIGAYSRSFLYHKPANVSPTKVPPPAMIGKSIRDINRAQVVFDFFFGK